MKLMNWVVNRTKNKLQILVDCEGMLYIMTGVAYGWILFHRLVSHMFRPIPPNKLNEFNMNSVPNRHASLHGLVQ